MSNDVKTDNKSTEQIKNIIDDNREYKYGFVSDIEQEFAPKGLNEDIIRFISAKKNEPEFMLKWRLKAYKKWLTMREPKWARVQYPPINYQDIYYYAAPKDFNKKGSNVSGKIEDTYSKLGVSIKEENDAQINDHSCGTNCEPSASCVAVDAVFDSVSVATTFKKSLEKVGIIFCSFSEAVIKYPELIEKYLGSVVPYNDNFFAALNSAVFSDGSFIYIPKGVKAPMELSTYFRINAASTGQFERTLIIADEGSYVSYLEGCTAPMRDENQLHAAVVELYAHKNAEIKYSTVQNWYPGDSQGRGGIYNFVTKRGLCAEENSKISWTQVESGSAITWKYPSCILKGNNSSGEFYSVAITNNYQQADTGTKFYHLGNNTRSRIISKGISAGKSTNTFRSIVAQAKTAKNARNFSQCDSLLIGSQCAAHTFPTIKVNNVSSVVEHEATTSKVSDDVIFYLNQRGISSEDAISLIIHGYAKEVLQNLPMEFAVEAKRLLSISLEGSVG